MGRIFTKTGGLLLPILIGAAFLAHEAAAGTKIAYSYQAAQSNLPMISLETELARDAETYDDDKALVSSCTAQGQTQQTCLCVTHILKYELTLSEYRAAVRLYDEDQDAELVAASLQDEGIAPNDIRTARDMMDGLTDSGDFSERCSEARAYYRPKRR